MLTGDVRAYLPAFAPHHVAAVRAAAGISTGDATAGRTFLLGGPDSNTLNADFGRDAISLLRGFATDTFAGSHVALVNADYRWPIARPQRGVGTWPVFLHTVHAAVFADAGHAWTQTFDAGAIKYSAGARALRESRRRLLASVRGNNRRRVGPRRQRTAPRPRDGVFPRRHGVLAEGRLLRADR